MIKIIRKMRNVILIFPWIVRRGRKLNALIHFNLQLCLFNKFWLLFDWGLLRRYCNTGCFKKCIHNCILRAGSSPLWAWNNIGMQLSQCRRFKMRWILDFESPTSLAACHMFQPIFPTQFSPYFSTKVSIRVSAMLVDNRGFQEIPVTVGHIYSKLRLVSATILISIKLKGKWRTTSN